MLNCTAGGVYAGLVVIHNGRPHGGGGGYDPMRTKADRGGGRFLVYFADVVYTPPPEPISRYTQPSRVFLYTHYARSPAKFAVFRSHLNNYRGRDNKLCRRPPQYVPAPCKLIFDLLTLKVVSESRGDVGYLCANFSLPRPLCSQLRPDVRDRRQTRIIYYCPLP